MPYSHHSHSGEFCNHAVDQLDDVIKEATRQGMQTYALTEHMPRDEEADLYPGESTSGWSIPEQAITFERYYHKARKLQEQYKGKIEILVGFEIDWIRPESKQWVESLLAKYPVDLFVGSVHHVYGIPIDYDDEYYGKAIKYSATLTTDQDQAAEQKLFEDYFDTQYQMLQALQPPVVGHFDLIRLLSKNRNTSWETYPEVWPRIKRNLQFIQSYGGLIEFNSSGLRKGLHEPYPKLEICMYFNTIGGRFVMSDDSHGIKQVGHSYEGVLRHAEMIGLNSIAVLTRDSRDIHDKRFPDVGIKEVLIDTVKQQDFWRRRGGLKA